jgi:hypothetical protein
MGTICIEVARVVSSLFGDIAFLRYEILSVTELHGCHMTSWVLVLFITGLFAWFNHSTLFSSHIIQNTIWMLLFSSDGKNPSSANHVLVFQSQKTIMVLSWVCFFLNSCIASHMALPGELPICCLLIWYDQRLNWVSFSWNQ